MGIYIFPEVSFDWTNLENIGIVHKDPLLCVITIQLDIKLIETVNYLGSLPFFFLLT